MEPPLEASRAAYLKSGDRTNKRAVDLHLLGYKAKQFEKQEKKSCPPSKSVRSSSFTLASEESLVEARRFAILAELAEARVTLSDVGPAGVSLSWLHGVNAPGKYPPPFDSAKHFSYLTRCSNRAPNELKEETLRLERQRRFQCWI